MLTSQTTTKTPPPPMPSFVPLARSAFGARERISQAARTGLLRFIDSPWTLIPSLKTHVVVCGFPRSGSTLLQLMCEACVSGVHSFGRERNALRAARTTMRWREMMITKRPNDVFRVDQIRKHYQDRRASARFLLTLRDPRDVLVSFHAKDKSRYYVSPYRWSSTLEHLKHVARSEDSHVVRFEDLILRPDETQEQINHFVGWQSTRPLRDFLAVDKPLARFDKTALNGLRKLDPSAIGRWRAPEHTERVTQILKELPNLPTELVELGYEQDTSWANDYLPQNQVAIC